MIVLYGTRLIHIMYYVYTLVRGYYRQVCSEILKKNVKSMIDRLIVHAQRSRIELLRVFSPVVHDWVNKGLGISPAMSV